MAGATRSLGARMSPSATAYEKRLATRDSGLAKAVVLGIGLTFFLLFICCR